MNIEIINKNKNKSIIFEDFIKDTGILLTKFDPGNIPAIFNTVKSVGQIGKSNNSTTLEDRIVRVEAIILSDYRDTIEEIKKTVDDILNPLNELLIKYNSDNISKQIECKCVSTPSYSTDYHTNNSNALSFSQEFECFNPLWQSQSSTTCRIETWGDGFEFEFELAEDGVEFAKKFPDVIEINNTGNVEAPLEIYFKGPALNPKISLNFNEFIKVNKKIEDDETLYISTPFGHKKVLILGANETKQAYNYVDVKSTFFNLPSGKSLITYETEGDYLPQSVYLKYRKNYLSI